MSDDLVDRLQARKVFNGNTTVRRDHSGAPWREEKQFETDPLCAEAAARIAELEAALLSIARNTCCGPCQEAAAVARAALGITSAE